MRTTIDLDDRLLREAKKQAAERGVPLRQIIEECLARGLAPRRREPAPPLRWKTTAGPAAPGTDFADRDRLYDAMNET